MIVDQPILGKRSKVCTCMNTSKFLQIYRKWSLMFENWSSDVEKRYMFARFCDFKISHVNIIKGEIRAWPEGCWLPCHHYTIKTLTKRMTINLIYLYTVSVFIRTITSNFILSDYYLTIIERFWFSYVHNSICYVGLICYQIKSLWSSW